MGWPSCLYLDHHFEELGNCLAPLQFYCEVAVSCSAFSAAVSENRDWRNLECVLKLAVTVEILSLCWYLLRHGSSQMWAGQKAFLLANFQRHSVSPWYHVSWKDYTTQKNNNVPEQIVFLLCLLYFLLKCWKLNNIALNSKFSDHCLIMGNCFFLYWGFKELVFSRVYFSRGFLGKAIALAGNRTRVSRVAGENSSTEPPMLMKTTLATAEFHTDSRRGSSMNYEGIGQTVSYSIHRLPNASAGTADLTRILVFNSSVYKFI